METTDIRQSFIEQLQIQLATLEKKVVEAQNAIVEYNRQIQAVKEQIGE